MAKKATTTKMSEKSPIKNENIKASAPETEEQVGTIEAYWNQTDEEINESRRAKRIAYLKRDAENVIAELENKSDKAQENLEDYIRGSFSSSSSMSSIFELRMKVKIARKEHADAIEGYIELFGNKPVLQG